MKVENTNKNLKNFERDHTTMASLCQCFSLLLLLQFAILLSNLGSNAQLIPQSEVKSLQIISNKLKYSYWRDVSQASCNDGGRSFNNRIFTDISLSNVTCDCSFNEGTVCHVTNIQLKRLNLTGVLPQEFGNLVKLQEIDLTLNYINGAIPKSLSKIPLVTLSLLGNQITGSIPDEIGQIATLQYLILGDNRLEGLLPQSLGQLKDLRTMVLAGNNFIGPIPETFANLRNLNQLRINGNGISGKIPHFIGSLTNLMTLDIQGTSMEGPIPSSFSLLTNLTILRISDLNTASMPFPNLTSMINLNYLVPRNCFITGHIPDFIQNLSKLRLLDLSYNQLSGPVPNSMQKFPHLEFLELSYNNFTGSSPDICQQSNVNLVASYSSGKSNSGSWCLMKDLPCFSPKYHSLFINCGGSKLNFEGHEYEEGTSQGGPSNFFASGQKWAYSSTGAFLYNDNANFLALDSSTPSLTGIYQTARLAPLSLKYYGLCLQQGSYIVKLHFAEIMLKDDQIYSSVGRRIFDVEIQQEVLARRSLRSSKMSLLMAANLRSTCTGQEKEQQPFLPEMHMGL